jgi:SAM-dependent methyltransferase
MMSRFRYDDKVREYFAAAKEFEGGYEGEGGGDFFHVVANRFFRPFLLGRRWREFFSIVVVGPDDVVCDVGCGGGRYLLELARRGIGKGVGVDFSAEMIRLARAAAARSGIGNVEFIESAINESLPACDVLYALGFLTYCAEIEPYLGLFACRAHKRIILEFPWKADSVWGWVLRALCFGWARYRGLRIHRHSKDLIDAILARQGFVPTACRNFHFSWIVVYEPQDQTP